MDYKLITLVGKHGEGKKVKVSPQDYDKLSKYRWFYSNVVATNVKIGDKYKKVSMHRMIMNPPQDKVVDHINGDKLDNRRSNLRICTQKENTRNRKSHKGSISEYKGVTFIKELKKRKWFAYIHLDGKRKNIGTFKTEEEAARAYDYYAKKHFGEYARLNFGNDIPEKPVKKKLTTPYRGISWCKRDKRYTGRLVHKAQRYDIGYYKTVEEAVEEYNKMVVRVLGDKAYTKIHVIRSSQNNEEQ